MGGFTIPESVISEYITNFVFVDDRIAQEPARKVSSPEVTEIDEIETEEIEGLVVPAPLSEELEHTKEYEGYLSQKVYDSISKEGYLCDLFKFEKSKLDQCKKICKNSDVVILDWELSRVETHQSALEIIKSLCEENGLRFIYIYTVIKDLESIKGEVDRTLGVTCEGDYSDFRVGSIYFFVRSKDSEAGGINPRDICDSILGAISGKYKGLMSTFVLDFASTIRKQLPMILKRYDESVDSSIVNLMARMNEEFFNRVFSQIILSDLEAAILAKITGSPVINKTKISEFLGECEFMKELADAIESRNDEKMKELGSRVLKLSSEVFQKNCCISPTNGAGSFEDLMSNYEIFSKSLKYSLDKIILPKKIKGLEQKNILDGQSISSQLFPIICYLSLYGFEKEIDKVAKDIIDSHKRFQCILNTIRKDASFPSLTQGTILKDKDTYYLCITPLCDICWPKKIQNRYSFVLGEEISQDEVSAINRDRNDVSIIYLNSSLVTASSQN
jgi:hypothetical protein